MKQILLTTVLMMAVAGTAAAKGDKKMGAKEASAAERQQIEMIADRWERSFNAKDAQRLGQLFAPDATISMEMGTEAKGKEAIQRSFQQNFDGEQKNARVNATVDSVTMLSDTLALVDGHHEITGMGPSPMLGKAVVLISKVGEEWKIQALRSFADPPTDSSGPGVGGSGTAGMCPCPEMDAPAPGVDPMPRPQEVEPR